MAAARVGDDIAHSHAGLGMGLGLLAGVVAGAVIVGATIATGGAALAVVAAVGGAAGLASFGGLQGMHIGEASMGASCGRFVTGSPNVFINGRPATFTFGAMASCSKDSGPIPLATGAATVAINFGLAGREGEKLGCSAVSIKRTSPNVFIGGPSANDPRVAIQPEVPGWAVTGLQVLGIAGLIATLPFSIAAVGVAATLGGLAGGFLGAGLGARGGLALGEALGLSEAQIRGLEAAGGFLGGLAGGVAGGKGAGALGERYLPPAKTPLGVALRQGRTGGDPAAVAAANQRTADIAANAERLGLPTSKVQEILDTPKFDPAVPRSGRPPPEDYVSPERMAEHSDAFANGASRYTLKSSYDKYGLAQRDGTTFVSTPQDADAIAARAAGDPRKLEEALGLPRGQLDGDQLLRIDLNKEAMKDLNVRMPSGNEAGANDKWLPGGYLPGGENEAVLNGIKALPHHFTIRGM